jgi:hypothetical protein
MRNSVGDAGTRRSCAAAGAATAAAQQSETKISRGIMGKVRFSALDIEG